MIQSGLMGLGWKFVWVTEPVWMRGGVLLIVLGGRPGARREGQVLSANQDRFAPNVHDSWGWINPGCVVSIRSDDGANVFRTGQGAVVAIGEGDHQSAFVIQVYHSAKDLSAVHRCADLPPQKPTALANLLRV